MNKLLINGVLLEENKYPISVRDRAFRFGDGVFETIKIANGYPIFYQHHYARFVTSINYLGFTIDDSFSAKFFYKEIERIITANNLNNAIVRILGVRNGEGTYSPDIKGAYNRIVFSTALEENSTFFASSTINNIGVFKDELKFPGRLANIKTNNALLYILAKNKMQDKGWQDAIILNTFGRIAEATSSNIFTYKDGLVKTPALTEGCIAGVMRSMIRKLCKWNKIDFEESQISLDDLIEAEEVFVTNAANGVTPVLNFNEKQYTTAFANGLLIKLNERVAQILEKR